MRKSWIVSFVFAFVVLACAVALITVGFVQMAPKVYTQNVGYFRSLQVSYSSSNTNLGFALIFLGGISVLASILLFILSWIIRSHVECCDCCDAEFIASEMDHEEEPEEVKEEN